MSKGKIDWFNAPAVPAHILVLKAKGATVEEMGGQIVEGPMGQQTFIKFGQKAGQSLGQGRVDPGVVYGCAGKNFGMSH